MLGDKAFNLFHVCTDIVFDSPVYFNDIVEAAFSVLVGT
jgi:hypothetical protein